jgi:hypothetical protein
MSLLDYVLPFLLALGILIVVHEFGHYQRGPPVWCQACCVFRWVSESRCWCVVPAPDKTEWVLSMPSRWGAT